MREIKLIWDFHGPDAENTAQHHQQHLNEFILKEHLALQVSSSEKLSELHSIASMLVNENEMVKVRDALKPHRAQVHKK